ncbi:MAG: (2Fe-2S) ferredoxin domain-containing protein [Nitrospiraceae bacterium]|nr:(2Fe-2S) ferredoxin domain-containing protein [Nitrospiraceae bacterium]
MPGEARKLTVEDLKRIKEEHRATFTLREGGYRAKVTVNMGTCGIAAGAREVMNALVEELSASGAKDVIVTTAGCGGLCSREPMAWVEIAGQPVVRYCDLNGQKIKRIFKEHILDGRVVEEYALAVGDETSY